MDLNRGPSRRAPLRAEATTTSVIPEGSHKCRAILGRERGSVLRDSPCVAFKLALTTFPQGRRGFTLRQASRPLSLASRPHRAAVAAEWRDANCPGSSASRSECTFGRPGRHPLRFRSRPSRGSGDDRGPGYRRRDRPPGICCPNVRRLRRHRGRGRGYRIARFSGARNGTGSAEIRGRPRIRGQAATSIGIGWMTILSFGREKRK